MTRRIGAALYDRAALVAASTVVEEYSTSFARACRLLGSHVRGHVRAIYGLVRIADEVVDAPDLALTPDQRARELDRLERETTRALSRGFSTNLIVHSFAQTARTHGIDDALIGPFFASMRTDLTRSQHDATSLDHYVYGSAEVVGLMCLRVFVGAPDAAGASYDVLSVGARRLGAAFQKVNFLRDLGADDRELGRGYLPGVASATLTDTQRDSLLDEVDADLAAARSAISSLPNSSRRAVLAAHDLFAELSRRLRRTPARTIAHTRVRVPGWAKARIVLHGRLVEATGSLGSRAR